VKRKAFWIFDSAILSKFTSLTFYELDPVFVQLLELQVQVVGGLPHG
jgi:hypothetical protein